MEINDLSDLIKADEREINPFRLLGIEAWVLRSMKFDDLKRFLSDFRRTIARYHHPDQYQDTLERKKHESYFKLLSSSVDRLLKDEFYFRQSLDKLRSGGMIDDYQNEINHRDAEINILKEELKSVKASTSTTISKLRNNLDEVNDIFYNIADIELQLVREFDAFPLRGLKSYIRFCHFYEDSSFNRSLDNIFKSTNSRLSLEFAARRLVKTRIKERYYVSDSERIKERRRLKAEGKKEEYTTIFKADLNGSYCSVRRKKKPASKFEMRIIGGLTYSAINEYFKFKKSKLIELEDSSYRIKDEFCFNIEDRNSEKAYLKRISPFVSNFIFLYTLAIVKEHTKIGKRDFDYYRLIIPTSITQIRAL